MNSFTVSQNNYVSQTLVPNRFIDEYMIDANDAQIKIYLFLLRSMSARKPTSVSEIADVFNYTEQDVKRALRYWEKKKLLTLRFDADKNLCGIHIECLCESIVEPKAGTGAEIISITKNSAAKPAAEATAASCSAEAAAASCSAEATAAASCPAVPTDAPLFEKPLYSMERLSAFQKREATQQLMFAIQTYIGRPLSQSNVSTILFLSDTLHFSNDLIDYLIQYCVERGKKSFAYIEKVAVTWAENHITTPKEASRFCARYDRTVYSVMRALGKGENPTDREVSYIRKWTGDYAFDLDIITEACERTVLATDKHRFEYADGILSSWHKSNVRRKADIIALDASHKAAAEKERIASDKNAFNQFRQNAYNFDELEKEILSN